MNDGSETAELFRVQFAKAHYNIGLLFDKQGQAEHASANYKKAMKVCETDPKGHLVKSATYKKAATNYAVTLEKLSQREEAVSTLESIKNTFCNEVRVYNNLGIIQKRNNNQEAAM